MGGLALGVLSAKAAPPMGATIALQPHRIAYEVSLGARPGSSLAAAQGLITVEFTGSPCVGYTTQFRQAMRLADADGGQRMLDFAIRNIESGKGDSFRFTVLNKVNGATMRDARGEALRVKDGSISVRMLQPHGKKGDFDGTAVFPTAMLVDMLNAAQRGERRFDARVFDGSEGGEKIYETVSTIGAPLAGDKNARVEAALQAEVLKDVPRWPVTTAYFEQASGDRSPLYTTRSVTFANGVVGDLTFEFPEFSLSARAVRYEQLPLEACK